MYTPSIIIALNVRTWTQALFFTFLHLSWTPVAFISQALFRRDRKYVVHTQLWSGGKQLELLHFLPYSFPDKEATANW